MEPIHVGLVADPALPTDVARRMCDLQPSGGADRHAWDIELVSEPFTTGSENADTALARLGDHARERDWEVPGVGARSLRDDGPVSVTDADVEHGDLRSGLA